MRRWALAMATLCSLTACSAPQRATFEMSWRYEDDRTCDTMRHVVLRFVDYPAYVYGFCSDELAAYLDTLPTHTVPVEFEVYAPEAQLGGGDPVRIGALERWAFEFAHTGTEQDSLTAEPPRHPWERFRSSE